MAPLIIVLGIVTSVLEGVGIGLFLPLLEQRSVSGATPKSGAIWSLVSNVLAYLPTSSRDLWIGSFIVGALLLKATVSWAAGYVAARINHRVGHHLRSRVFAQLLNSGYGFLSRHEWGALLETLSTETWRTMQMLSFAMTAVTSIFTIAVFMSLLALISWRLTLLATVGMLLFSLLLRLLTRPVRTGGAEATAVNARLGAHMVDGVLGVRSIQLFNLQSTMQDQFDRLSNRVSTAFLRVEAWSGLVTPFAEMSSAVVLLAIILVVGPNPANWAVLVLAVMVIYRLQTPFKQLETARVNIAGLIGAAESVSSYLEQSADRPSLGGRLPFRGLEREIRLDHVSYSYGESDAQALKDVGIRIPKGQVTALVGMSGAGKTTLLNLLCGLYAPTAGKVLVDDMPLDEIIPESWRAKLALAGQDVYLFNTSIRENIRYGRMDATEEEIAHAAAQAAVDEFARHLPDGYNTMVGDNGIRLSGGQRQRIALARAFLRKPEILILDEATNALDSVSEHWVYSALEQFERQCTVIIAAHRFATIQRAHQVIVLEDGRVIEQGQPSHLLRKDGVFAQLHQLQTLL